MLQVIEFISCVIMRYRFVICRATGLIPWRCVRPKTFARLSNI